MSGVEARFRLQREGFSLDVALGLPGSGVSVLFGPSGCGKTSVLRCAAGLTRADEGVMRIGEECWQDSGTGRWLPTHRRPLGYVFQEPSLFPHLSVRGNLAFAGKRCGRRDPPDGDLLELLAIDGLLDRMPSALSGGERQRVAIARALGTSPRLLLMDEPLAALDAPRKREILPYLERLHQELSIPVLYVTHALEEVARLADHLVLMEQGRVVMAGPVGEVMASLESPLAATDQAAVVVDARVSGHDASYGLTRLDVNGVELWTARVSCEVGHRLRLRIHARDVSLALFRPEGSSITNILPAVIEAIAGERAGDDAMQCLVRLRTASGARLLARVTRRSRDLLALEPGMVVYAQIKAVVPVI
ncbi:MAG: molybdenum ABC transporter ATP-binding protein [Rhodocyclaceae bacterium]|nr:molybdenum ABC transporter ATP-binding protein [Rhodocyclaceae bacterium]